LLKVVLNSIILIPSGWQMRRDMFPSYYHSWFITGFVIRVRWRVPLVEQELLTLPEHLSSPPVVCGVRVAHSFVFCIVFCRSLLSLFLYNCIASSSSSSSSGDRVAHSCNNVAPVTNLCVGRATTRSHSSQWSKKKVAVET
jgi:hypothetical protein